MSMRRNSKGVIVFLTLKNEKSKTISTHGQGKSVEIFSRPDLTQAGITRTHEVQCLVKGTTA